MTIFHLPCTVTQLLIGTGRSKTLWKKTHLLWQIHLSMWLAPAGWTWGSSNHFSWTFLQVKWNKTDTETQLLGSNFFFFFNLLTMLKKSSCEYMYLLWNYLLVNSWVRENGVVANLSLFPRLMLRISQNQMTNHSCWNQLTPYSHKYCKHQCSKAIKYTEFLEKWERKERLTIWSTIFSSTLT